ncbi:MAG: hypothetical protein COA80_00660 [Leeuwenhoekiella sp.]|nr:MAG: hypothetical protein COA80_00660 [Leeuwenhoekiella sp.]
MWKYILLDKLIRPFQLTLPFIILINYYSDDVKFIILSPLIILVVISVFSFLITDRYLVAFETESGERQLRYRKGFSKKEEIITYTSDAVYNVDPNGNSLFYPIYKFKLYYTSQDGVEAEKTFKTNDTKLFNKIMADVYTCLSQDSV